MNQTKLAKQNIKILGSINPAIIQPKWLASKNIIEAKTNAEWLFPVGEVIAPLRFKIEKLEWLVDYKSLEIYSHDPELNERVEDFVSKIFDFLIETPVIAIGHNFSFKSKSDSLSPLFLENENWCVGKEFEGMKIEGITQNIKVKSGENQAINIKITKGKNEISFDFNFHYNVKIVKEMKRPIKDYKNNFLIAKQYVELINN